MIDFNFRERKLSDLNLMKIEEERRAISDSCTGDDFALGQTQRLILTLTVICSNETAKLIPSLFHTTVASGRAKISTASHQSDD